jgi:hypothetical protein
MRGGADAHQPFGAASEAEHNGAQAAKSSADRGNKKCAASPRIDPEARFFKMRSILACA